MSFWSEFLDSFKEAGKGLLGINPASVALQSGASLAGMGIKNPEVAAATGIAAQSAIQQKLISEGISPVTETAIKPFDPVLLLAEKAEKYVFSPYIARPISTAYLATDPDSALYNSDKYGKGFQLSDIKNAYNRSADVSLGQSLLKSPLGGLLALGENQILKANGIDVSGIDLWDDQDIQTNFKDNTLGKWITGTNDFIIKNVAINVAFAGAGAAAKAGATRAGLSTKFKAGDVEAMPVYEKDMYDHINFVEGNGGTQTVIGSEVMNLAASDNIIDITRILKKHTYNPAMPDLVRSTKDPRVVADLILADKGYGPAIERLASLKMSDDLWVIGDGNSVIRNEYLLTGKMPVYTAEQRARWTAAFDDAIAKNPKHQEIYDAFLRQELDDATGVLVTAPVAAGKYYKPIEPIVGKGIVSAARTRTGQLKTARLERDFSDVGGVAQVILGSRVSGPITVLMRKFGTFMPKGIVTNSGLRPMDGIDELMAVFDDAPLFANGSRVITTHTLEQTTVSQYRLQIIDRFVAAKSDGERAAVVKAVNKELAATVAYSRGYFNKQQIDAFVETLMDDVSAVHGSLGKDGFAMDPTTSVRIKVDPVTQRQLANSEAMLPFGELDRMILKAARKQKGAVVGAATTAEQALGTAARGIFEASSRVFSIAQLYRFSYIPKNSIIEPMLAGTLAEGSKFLTPMVKTASASIIKKTAKVIIRNVQKAATLGKSAKKEIQDEVKALSEQYNRAIITRDDAYAIYEAHFGVGARMSPAAKRDWSDSIKERLKDAERDVNVLEQKLNVYAIEYGAPINVPSVYGLRRRIQALKDANDPRFAGEIAAAEMRLARAVEDINSLAPELNVANQQIAQAYDDLGKIFDELGPKVKEQSEIFQVSEGLYAKQPMLDPIQRVTLSNGQVLEFKSFANRDGFGEGYMSEISSNHTRTMELLGNKATVVKMSTIMSRSPKSVTNVSAPEYFDELAYVVNNHLRGDLMVDQILAGATRQDLIKWVATPQGRYYAKTMGVSREELVQLIDDNIIIVNRYLPTAEAKLAAAEGQVMPNQLRGMLAENLDQMSAIHPLDIQYGRPTTISKNVVAAIDSLTSSAWKTLMAPENVIREVWGTSRHSALVAERAEMLLAQGVQMDVATLNQVHHAAAIQLVDEVARTFYTIPRQHRALYLARGLATFPNAAASGIYRYSRFAVKKPRRFAGFLNSYYGLYDSFGVDQDGNPVDDPMKASFLLVPGTKEMGLNNGKGVVINSRATNYIANFPGASWMVPIALSNIYGNKPNDEDEIKNLIDSTFGKIPGYSYDELFPFGIEPDTGTQLKNTFTPAWARNLAMGLKPDMTNKMFVDSWISESNRQWILYDMGKGPKPTEKSVMFGAKSIYMRKFRTQFFSLIGTPQYVESKPDSLYDDYYFSLVNTYQMQGKNIIEANDLAEKDFQAHMQAETGSEFPMDRRFVSAQDSVTYITPSQKAYDRIWDKFPGLTTKLRQIDPSVIGLMVADLPKDYSPQVNKFLKSTTARFPDGTPVNSALKTPQLVEEEIEKSRFWAAYTAEKKRLNDAAVDAQYKSYANVPELKERLRDYALNTLGKGSFAWLQEYKKNATQGNQAQIQAQGLYTIVNDKEFMRQYGKTQFWQHAKGFVDLRNKYAITYRDAPTGTKGDVKDNWIAYLQESIDLWDPTLQRIITRYFENDNLKESS